MATEAKGTSSSDDEDNATATEDHSILCRPIQTGQSGIQLAVNSLKNGTAEIRDLLLNECDLIFECKVCRSLHRSLVNFIAHKRGYCEEHCCEAMPLFSDNTIENEEVLVVQPESPPEQIEPISEEQQNEVKESPVAEEESDNVILNIKTEPTSQLEVKKEEEKTEVKTSPQKIFVRKLRESPRWRRSGSSNGNSTFSPSRISNGSGSISNFHHKCLTRVENRKIFQLETTVAMSPIASNSNAVHQKVNETALTVASSFKKTFKSNEKRALCAKCGKSFTSLRKMVVHVQSVHTTQRTYFPCLYCKTNFAQIWSCLRHMMRAHGKSKQQVDKLREKIKSKAFQKSVDGDGKDAAIPKPESPVKMIFEDKLPVVQLINAVIHQCNICSKIFSQKPSLDGHRSSCLAKERARENAKKLAEAEAEMDLSGSNCNERPRRAVKRKLLDEDFVNSSYLNIRTNSVNPPKQPEHKATVSITSIPQNILLKLNAIIDIDKKQCLQCRQSFVTLSNARRHAAGHIGYNRFSCKKCEFQAYGRSQIRCHILKVHVIGKTKVKESDLDRLILNIESKNDENDQPKMVVKVEESEQESIVDKSLSPEKIDTSDSPVITSTNGIANVDSDEAFTSPKNVEVINNYHSSTLNGFKENSPKLSGSDGDFVNDLVVAIVTEDKQEKNGYRKPSFCRGKLGQIINKLRSNKDNIDDVCLVEESDESFDNNDQNSSSYAPDDHNYYASSPDKCSVELENELLEAVGSITG
ncbi:hypothetical protein CHUAL_000840 [Chamberlinius hualienensis]